MNFENMMRDNMLKSRIFKIPDDIKEPQHRISWWKEQCCILSAKEAAETLEAKLQVAIEKIKSIEVDLAVIRYNNTCKNMIEIDKALNRILEKIKAK